MTSPDRYVRDARIGEGGAGHVWRAWDQELGRWVAIKRVRPGTDIAQEIRREAGVLAQLQHPNIVTIFDVDEDEDGTSVVMELVVGQTLDEVIETDGRMDPATFREFAIQTCRGLGAAHARGLVHHDIKPRNIMFHRHDDGTFTVKVLDFGLACVEPGADAALVPPDEIVGSLMTIAPEQLERQPATARSDIYSLGCVFYHALTGRAPFDMSSVDAAVQAHLKGNAMPVHIVRPDVPVGISSVIAAMMRRQPADRIASVQEVCDALQGVAMAGPVPPALSPRAPAPSVAAPAPAVTEAKPRRTARLVPALAVSLVMTGLVAAGLWWARLQPRNVVKEVTSPDGRVERVKTVEIPAGNVKAVREHRGEVIFCTGRPVALSVDPVRHRWLLSMTPPSQPGLRFSLPQDEVTESDAREYIGRSVRVEGIVALAGGGEVHIEVARGGDVEVRE
jgi:hypothetical protein